MMNWVILALLILAATSFVIGGLSRFLKFKVMGHEPTTWWHGSVGFLGFSFALMAWEILQILAAR